MRREWGIFSVIAFNINDNLSKKEVELKRVLQKQIDKHRNYPTLINLAEAYRPDEVDQKFVYSFGRYLGQIATSTPYESADGRSDDHVLYTSYDVELMESQPELTRVRLASRNALRIAINSPKIGGRLSFFGVHLDDRSEASRLEQVDALLDIVEPNDRTIIAGDFNAMKRETAAAQIARTFGKLGEHWRPESIDPDPKTGKRTFAAKLYGLADMAIGTTMGRLADAKFRDADDSYYPQSTIHMAPVRLGPRIDHVVAQANAGMTIMDLSTFRGPSDHSGVRVTYLTEQLVA